MFLKWEENMRQRVDKEKGVKKELRCGKYMSQSPWGIARYLPETYTKSKSKRKNFSKPCENSSF